MKVLVACEFSGIVRDAFSRRGHDAMSCDLLPTERPGWHYQGDVRDVLDREWDLMIAHPPCTYLCNTAVRWLHTDDGRWEKLNDACDFFITLWSAPIPKIAIENPIMHKYALERIKRKYDQIIQPWQFGHGETKATCLWLKNLPGLTITHKNDDFFCKPEPKQRVQRIYLERKSPTRWMERSRTYQGIADAMADQWGKSL